MEAEFTFKKTKMGDGHLVYSRGVFLGRVAKENQWVVRGNRVVWHAYANGYVGNADTRIGAARLLLERAK